MFGTILVEKMWNVCYSTTMIKLTGENQMSRGEPANPCLHGKLKVYRCVRLDRINADTLRVQAAISWQLLNAVCWRWNVWWHEGAKVRWLRQVKVSLIINHGICCCSITTQRHFRHQLMFTGRLVVRLCLRWRLAALGFPPRNNNNNRLTANTRTTFCKHLKTFLESDKERPLQNLFCKIVFRK